MRLKSLNNQMKRKEHVLLFSYMLLIMEGCKIVHREKEGPHMNDIFIKRYLSI